VGTSILPNTVAAYFALRRLPGISLSPKWFEWRAVRAQMGFSITAYLITFSNMLMSKSDQLVISLTLGVAFVAIYQAGFKMGEMLGMFSVQLQQVLSPAAAAMHARGDESGLRNLLLRSSRLSFLLVTPAYLLSAVYLEPLIRLLTGMESVPRETWWIGQALLLAIYSSQITNSCSKRVLMMCGEEKKLLQISIAEAVANVVLSIVLAYRMGVLGVAIGTMIPTMLVGWFWVVPVTIRRLKLPLVSYLGYHARGTVIPLAVFSSVLLALALLIPATGKSGFLDLGWRGALCMAPLVFLGRNVMRGMSKSGGEDEVCVSRVPAE
jgi:O-antigen/teichoic acid export membrane protein